MLLKTVELNSGASWCPTVCNKKNFQTAVKELPYIECSTVGQGSTKPKFVLMLKSKVTQHGICPGVMWVIEIIPMDLASIINYPF